MVSSMNRTVRALAVAGLRERYPEDGLPSSGTT
mgnify:FL=1